MLSVFSGDSPEDFALSPPRRLPAASPILCPTTRDNIAGTLETVLSMDCEPRELAYTSVSTRPRSYAFSHVSIPLRTSTGPDTPTPTACTTSHHPRSPSPRGPRAYLNAWDRDRPPHMDSDSDSDSSDEDDDVEDSQSLDSQARAKAPSPPPYPSFIWPKIQTPQYWTTGSSSSVVERKLWSPSLPSAQPQQPATPVVLSVDTLPNIGKNFTVPAADLARRLAITKAYRRQRGQQVLRLVATRLVQTGQFATLAGLLSLSSSTYSVVSMFLYGVVHITKENAGSFFNALVEPRTGNTRDPLSAPNRRDRMRCHNNTIIVSSLPYFAPSMAAFVGTKAAPPPPLLSANSLAIKSGAWTALGNSTLLSQAVAGLACPKKVCFDIGAKRAKKDDGKRKALRPTQDTTAASVRLAALSITTILLPSWSQLTEVTIHRAQVLLLNAGQYANGLFVKGVRYTLFFSADDTPSPVPSPGHGHTSTPTSSFSLPIRIPRSSSTAGWPLWQAMIAALKPHLANFAGTVVIPHDQHGTLWPRGHEDAPLSHLPGTARTLVAGRNGGANIRFIGIEHLSKTCCDICQVAHRSHTGSL